MVGGVGLWRFGLDCDLRIHGLHDLVLVFIKLQTLGRCGEVGVRRVESLQCHRFIF